MTFKLFIIFQRMSIDMDQLIESLQRDQAHNKVFRWLSSLSLFVLRFGSKRAYSAVLV